MLTNPAQNSGMYSYKNWMRDASGQLVARMARRELGRHPDLISTAYRNADGMRSVYGIVFDLDAERAEPKWLASNGSLDWPRMARSLARECPELAAAVTHVVRSTHGKGLAILLGINPLPIRASTATNQAAARSLQRRVVMLFERLGFGADSSAMGLERDFPNWRDPARVVLHIPARVRQLEAERTRLVTQLHRALNRVDKARQEARIYPDARAEAGVARLALWLLGERAPRAPRALLEDLRVGASQEECAPLRALGFLSGEEGFATVRQLQGLTGLGEGFLRKLLREPPSWLRAEHVSREEGWRLHVPLETPLLGVLLARGRRLQGQGTSIGSQWTARELVGPEEVLDGERNAWILKLALSYKWSGYSQATALEKVRLRAGFVPGCETSRNCRGVASIVRSIYRRMPEFEGRFPHRELPEWIREDAQFSHKYDNNFRNYFTRSNHGRGVAPGGREGLVRVAAHGPGISSPSSSRLTAPSHRPRTPRELAAKVEVIRFGQRIGLVRHSTGELFAVFTGTRHWREARVEAWLAGLPHFAGHAPWCHSPPKAAQAKYFDSVREWAHPYRAELVCGKKETLGERLSKSDWFCRGDSTRRTDA